MVSGVKELICKKASRLELVKHQLHPNEFYVEDS